MVAPEGLSSFRPGTGHQQQSARSPGFVNGRNQRPGQWRSCTRAPGAPCATTVGSAGSRWSVQEAGLGLCRIHPGNAWFYHSEGQISWMRGGVQGTSPVDLCPQWLPSCNCAHGRPGVICSAWLQDIGPPLPCMVFSRKGPLLLTLGTLSFPETRQHPQPLVSLNFVGHSSTLLRGPWK